MAIGHTDEPISSIESEKLGLCDYIEALAGFVMECQTPMTISVQGDWGTGKTSMMNLVKDRLIRDGNRVIPVWFNTWQFSQFNMQNHLPLSLIRHLIDELNIDESSVAKSLGRITRGLLKVAATSFIERTVGETNAAALTERGTEVDIAKEIVTLKEELGQLVVAKLKKEQKSRIIIFVDDIDRLYPERAVELLEVMKIFLDLKHCVFILAVDYSVIVQGLEKKYGKALDTGKYRSFFDKIIQLPFNLPVALYQTDIYLQSMLHDGSFDFSPTDLNLFLRIIEYSIGFNPRGLKRLFNAFHLLRVVANKKRILDKDPFASTAEKYRILFCILCLQFGYEGFYRYLLKQTKVISQDFFKRLAITNDPVGAFSEQELLELGLDTYEHRTRFTKFAISFFEAIQLSTDTAENAETNLSEEEANNFRTLLSFSSMVAGQVNTAEMPSSNSLFEDLSGKLVAMLNATHAQELAELRMSFAEQIERDQFDVFTDISLGHLSGRFVTRISRYGMTFCFDNIFPKGTKGNFVHGAAYAINFWAKKYLTSEFPSLEINNRKTYGYLTLRRIQFEQQYSQEQHKVSLEHVRSFLPAVYSCLFSKLLLLKRQRNIQLDQLRKYIETVKALLAESFPPQDGWLHEDRVNFGESSSITLSHLKWNNGITMQLRVLGLNLAKYPSEIHLSPVAFGVVRKAWGTQYPKEFEDQLTREFDSCLGPGGWTDQWFLRYKELPESAQVAKGNFFEESFSTCIDTDDRLHTAAVFVSKMFQTANGKLGNIISQIPHPTISP
ncbi:MAG TPA: P-loop NTPase fold protein [Candidatus Ozemobacteraceae bacterium]|nr:P-loop NTPase fold protein [Candidatus Ozemobacteraceae bacterium]